MDSNSQGILVADARDGIMIAHKEITCPRCYTRQMQLVRYSLIHADYRCRYCGKDTTVKHKVTVVVEREEGQP